MNHDYKSNLYYISQPNSVPEAYDSDGNDVDIFEPATPEPPVLETDHPWAQIVNELKLSVLEKFYLQRNRSETFPQRNLGMQQGTDSFQSSIPRDTELPLKHQFMCPFYIRDPVKHMSCFTKTSLRGIERVKQHLWNAHKLPPYCPMCGKIFSTTARCNIHIRHRDCGRPVLPTPEGITIQQMQQLAQPTEAQMPEGLQWLSIWAIVFPGADLPAVTYPLGPMESTVGLFRDYWAYNGKRLVSDFLEAKGFHSCNLQDEDHHFTALYTTVLYQVTDYLVESISHETSNEAIGGLSRS